MTAHNTLEETLIDPHDNRVSLLDLLQNASAQWPDQVAVGNGSRSVTFAQIAASSDRVAGGIAGLPGTLNPGDRILISLADGIDTVMAMWGVLKAGAAFSILHTDVRNEPLKHAIDDSQAVLLITDDPDKAQLAASRGIASRGVEELDGDPMPTTASWGDIAALIYTSGSTALPKAVVCPHEAMMFAVNAIQSQLGYRHEDVVYCPLPLSFDYGLYQVLLGARSGATVWLGDPAAAGPALLNSVRASEATVLASVPSVATGLMRLLQRSSTVNALPKLRLVTNTGAAMPPEILAGLRAQLPNLRVQLMFGLTECKRATIMPPDGDLARPGSSGLALPGTSVFVVNDAGERLPPGEVGQIVVSGPNVMNGYWRRAEATQERFGAVGSQRLNTGDYGWVDESGYLYFDGRRDDIYKERGFRVSANEVEAATMRVDGVQSATVLPPAGDEPSRLAVVAAIGADEIRHQLANHLEAFKVPHRIQVLPAMPLNQNGKVDKKALAEVLRD